MEHVATIELNVVAYSYNTDPKEKTPYKLACIDRDSFSVDLKSGNAHACSKEIQEKFEELRVLWEAWTAQKTEALDQTLTSQSSQTLVKEGQRILPSQTGST